VRQLYVTLIVATAASGSIIDGMKVRNCYTSFLARAGFEKLHNFKVAKLSFLRPVTSWPCRVAPLFLLAVAGMLAGSMGLALQSKPAAVRFCIAILSLGGLHSFQLSSLSAVVLAVRLFLFARF